MANIKVPLTTASIELQITQTFGLSRQHKQVVKLFVVLGLKIIPSQLLNKQPPCNLHSHDEQGGLL